MRNLTARAVCVSVITLILSGVSASAQSATFTPGNLVVLTYGNLTSNTYIDGNPTTISLLQFSPAIAAAATPTGTFALPTTASRSNVGVVGEYGSSSEGNLQLTGDGQFLTFCGYNAQQAANGVGQASDSANDTNVPLGTPYSNDAVGTDNSNEIALAQSANTDVSRVAVFVDSYGNINSSTTFNNIYSTNNPRSLYSLNESTIYISGQGSGTSDQGIYYAQAGTQNQPTTIYDAADTRILQGYGGNLYYSIDKKNVATGIFEFSGFPTSLASGSRITAASGAGANYSPEGYYFANATTLYVADTGVPKNKGTGAGGIQKWVYNGSAWQLQYEFPNPANFVAPSQAVSASSGETGFEAITGKVVNGVAYLYAVSYTAGDANPNGLYGITDTVSATALSGQAFTEIAASPGIQVSGTTPNEILSGSSPDYVFKGVSFAPQAPLASDTPTMPPWALIGLGALLASLAGFFLAQEKLAPRSS